MAARVDDNPHGLSGAVAPNRAGPAGDNQRVGPPPRRDDGHPPPGRGGPGLPPWLAAERRPPTREHTGLPPGFGALALGEEKYWWGPHATLRTRLDTRGPCASLQPAARMPAACKPAGRAHAPRRPSCHPRSPRRFPSSPPPAAATPKASPPPYRSCTKLVSQRRRSGPSLAATAARGDTTSRRPAPRQ